jgi:hypothetical protein
MPFQGSSAGWTPDQKERRCANTVYGPRSQTVQVVRGTAGNLMSEAIIISTGNDYILNVVFDLITGLVYFNVR